MPRARLIVYRPLLDLGYSGFYLDGKQLLPIAQFDHQRDQVWQNGKVGKYINNFLYFPDERAAKILERAQQLL